MIVVDGMEGGTGASPAILQEHTGIPTLAAVCEARAALEDIGLYGEVQLIIAGGIRDGVDAAKAMALGRGRDLHRHGGADRPELQPPHLHGGLPRAGRGAACIATIATQAAARSGSPRRIRS